MSLNFDKCKIMSVCTRHSPPFLFEYKYTDSDDIVKCFERVKFISDLGILFGSEISFADHIYNRINAANRMLGIIIMYFAKLSKYCFFDFVPKPCQNSYRICKFGLVSVYITDRGCDICVHQIPLSN